MIDRLAGKKAETAAILMGAALGVLAFQLQLRTFALAFAVLLITALVLWKHEIGVLLSVGLIPVCPTTPLLGLILLTIMSFLIRQFLKGSFTFRLTPLDPLLLFFAGAMLFSSLISYTRRSSLTALAIHLIIIAFYFVLTNTITNKQKLYAVIASLALTSAVAAAYGVYQYYTGDISSDAWVDVTMFEDIKTRVVSTFGNPNVLGEYLILVIPLTVALLWERKGWLIKLAIGGLAAIMLLCLIYTSSRGAWLGFIFAIGIFAVLRDRRFLALCLIGLLLVPFVLPPSYINRFTSIGNLQDSSSAYRLSIWLGSLKMLQDYWPSGIGLGLEPFKLIYPKYAFNAAYAHHSHNIYIQLVLETGIVGFLLFMGLLTVFYKNIFFGCNKVRDRFVSTLMIAAGAGLAGYLVHGIVENIWYNNRVLLTSWVVIALGMSAFKLAASKPEVEAVD